MSIWWTSSKKRRKSQNLNLSWKEKKLEKCVQIYSKYLNILRAITRLSKNRITSKTFLTLCNINKLLWKTASIVQLASIPGT